MSRHDNSGSRVALLLNLFCRAPEGMLGKTDIDSALVKCLEIEHFTIFLMEVAVKIQIVSIIIDFADVDHGEIVDEIFPKHIENAIILLLEAHFLFLRCR